MDQLKKLLEAGTITQETYDALSAEFTTVINQRDTVRRESADRRVKIKGIEKELNTFKAIATTIGDKFGMDLDSDEGLEKLTETLSNFDPDKKIDDSKVKELEIKLNRANKLNQDLNTNLENEKSSRIKILKSNQINKYLEGFDVIDRDSAVALLERRVTQDDVGDFKFKDKDGVLVGLKEGFKSFFDDEKQNLIKSQGQGHEGSGMKQGSVSATLKTSNSADAILKAAGI